jgi:hypothetical protein
MVAFFLLEDLAEGPLSFCGRSLADGSGILGKSCSLLYCTVHENEANCQMERATWKGTREQETHDGGAGQASLWPLAVSRREREVLCSGLRPPVQSLDDVPITGLRHTHRSS